MKYDRKLPVLFTGLIVIAFSIILGSCLKDIRDLTNIRSAQIEDDYNPEFAVPLLHANISALDFANKFEVDDFIRIEEDYLVTILYKSNTWYGYARDFIQIPDQQYHLGPLTFNTGGSDSIRVTSNILFDENLDYTINFLDGEETVFLDVKSGILVLNIVSSFPRSGQLEFTLPYAKKDNFQFAKTIPLDYHWPQISIQDTIDLTGIEFDLSKAGTTYNTVPVKFAITLNQNSRFVHASDQIQITTEFKDMEFNYIEGYLGARDIPYSADTLKLSIFDGTDASKVTFIDPKLKVNTYSSTGMPIRVDPPYINSFSKSQGSLQLTGAVVASSIDVGYPKKTEIGDVIFTGIIADKDNSNIPDVINRMPKYIDYDFIVHTNPDGKIYDNFALDTSFVKVNMELELPAFGRSEEWIFDFPVKVDPIDFDLKIIEEAELNLLIENEFPVELAIQLYILDSTETIIDSLLGKNNYLFAPATIGADYRTISTTTASTKILINSDRIDHIGNMRKIRALVYLSTNNKGQDDVKIFADSRLDLKLGLRTKLKVNLNDL
ncbi:MAG: hypothetical protein ISR55_04695 [Bacteroidetes bacterium]|nr:hypothetical protein [Bacteroidota bacterium]MBL6963098.1 hypothetical protein [Bacteroidota bacterium]